MGPESVTDHEGHALGLAFDLDDVPVEGDGPGFVIRHGPG
jgi:hypothetical protein